MVAEVATTKHILAHLPSIPSEDHTQHRHLRRGILNLRGLTTSNNLTQLDRPHPPPTFQGPVRHKGTLLSDRIRLLLRTPHTLSNTMANPRHNILSPASMGKMAVVNISNKARPQTTRIIRQNTLLSSHPRPRHQCRLNHTSNVRVNQVISSARKTPLLTTHLWQPLGALRPKRHKPTHNSSNGSHSQRLAKHQARVFRGSNTFSKRIKVHHTAPISLTPSPSTAPPSAPVDSTRI